MNFAKLRIELDDEITTVAASKAEAEIDLKEAQRKFDRVSNRLTALVSLQAALKEIPESRAQQTDLPVDTRKA